MKRIYLILFKIVVRKKGLTNISQFEKLMEYVDVKVKLTYQKNRFYYKSKLEKVFKKNIIMKYKEYEKINKEKEKKIYGKCSNEIN